MKSLEHVSTNKFRIMSKKTVDEMINNIADLTIKFKHWSRYNR